MEKKNYILQMIDTFEQSANPLPRELQQKFDSIREQLGTMTPGEFVLKQNLVVTTPADEAEYHPNQVMYLLEEAYSHMEDVAKKTAQDGDRTLLTVVQQMRGFLDVPERYFP